MRFTRVFNLEYRFESHSHFKTQKSPIKKNVTSQTSQVRMAQIISDEHTVLKKYVLDDLCYTCCTKIIKL